MLFKILQNIARRVFEKAITDVDNTLRKKRERGILKNTGKKGKYFLTRSGDILYSPGYGNLFYLLVYLTQDMVSLWLLLSFS